MSKFLFQRVGLFGVALPDSKEQPDSRKQSAKSTKAIFEKFLRFIIRGQPLRSKRT